MRFIEAGPDSPVIRELTRRVNGDVCTLQWQWPSGSDSLYFGRRALAAAHDPPPDAQAGTFGPVVRSYASVLL